MQPTRRLIQSTCPAVRPIEGEKQPGSAARSIGLGSLLLALQLACAGTGCSDGGREAGGDPVPPGPDAAATADGGTGEPTDSGEDGSDVATGDSGSGLPDAGLLDAETPLPVPDWDAALAQVGPPAGYAYAENKGSYMLSQPQALANAFQVLAADTRDVRLFANEVQSEDGGLGVDYGAVFLEDAGAQYQYPESVGHFRIAPSTESANTYVSEPFDYRLKAWVPSPLSSDTGYLLELSSRQAVWVAEFDAEFATVTQGSLRAAVLRSEAEEAPFELDALSCLGVCSNVTACTGGLSVLSDLLDCNDAETNVDADGDGENDAYRLLINFSSEQITFQ